MNENSYEDTCPQCTGTIVKDYETDVQMGRCKGCGYHEKDGEYTLDPTKPLDFNDD
jgi:ribosomal protein L37AE/L43A